MIEIVRNKGKISIFTQQFVILPMNENLTLLFLVLDKYIRDGSTVFIN